MKRTPEHPNVQPRLVRCAIYTRKSTEEGLQQAFNTLDAQRESAEAYIASQKTEGWTCLPDRYDDGGFTGGNIERPAVKRLLADIEAGKVDCVVVYKVDRLSRSLLDFARMMSVFDEHHVSFVSVTQHFNTTHSMGRLTLNILLSFAQFEREIISERTRDKIAAARRKGKFAGGRPVLGYDLLSDPRGAKLIVNEDEAGRVRQIFKLYLKHEGLIPTVNDINARGWGTKCWPTTKGTTVGGKPFDKCTLFNLLTNVIYIGKVRHKDEVHDGEQPAIIDEALWQKVQARLQHNGRSGGTSIRNKHGALLKGLLRCSACDCSMGHSYTAKGSKRYRYYVCLNAQKRGWDVCPARSVPAGEIEAFVVEQIKSIGRDPRLLEATIAQTNRQHETALTDLRQEEQTLRREHARLNARLGKLAGHDDPRSLRELAEVEQRIGEAEQRAAAIVNETSALHAAALNEGEVKAALTAFSPLWDTLAPREQARVIRLLVERVEYDGNEVAVTFRPGAMIGQPLEIA